MKEYKLINKDGKTIGDILSHNHFTELHGLILRYGPNIKLRKDDSKDQALENIDNTLKLLETRILAVNDSLQESIDILREHYRKINGGIALIRDGSENE